MFQRMLRHFAVVISLVALWPTSTEAHEGHAPLPTKGVRVDSKKGLIAMSSEAVKSLGLQTTPVEQRVLEERALAYATLVTPWQRQHFVGSPLSGRIAALHVVTGATVEAGQLLAEVASTELEAFQLELRTAMNQLRLAARQVERLRALVEGQAVAERELLEANAKYQQDAIAVQIGRRKLRSLGLTDEAIDLSLEEGSGGKSLQAPLFSPVRGTVSHADLAIGKVISANEHLFEVNDLSQLWVKIGVLERDIPNVRGGQRVELVFSAFPQQTFATVVSIPPIEVDPVTHVATAWAEMDNPTGSTPLIPGMYGTARIVTSEPTKLLNIPVSALLGTGAERFVLVEVAATSKGSEFRRRNVVVAAQNASFAQVYPGALVRNDRVVSTGGQVLSSFFVLGSLRLSKEGIRNVGLQVEPVAKQIVEDVLSLDGMIDLQPGSVAGVSSQLAGKLTRVHVERGERVRAGQMLAEVACLPLQDTQLTMLKSDLEAKLLDNTLQRLSTKGSTPVIAARRIWETESARDAAVNRRESARQTLITMGMTKVEVDQVLTSGETISSLPIRSPIDGQVVRFDKVLGEGVVPEETIFEVHDMSRPWAKVFLAEGNAPKVPVGTSVRVRLLSDPKFLAEGKVVQSARTLNVENRTLAVWVEFLEPLPKPLQRNLLARISATIGSPAPTLAVPGTSIVREQSRSYVFVQKSGGLLERRVVEPGRADDRFVEIRRGLEVGEQIAVQGVAELQTTYASVR